MSRNSSILLGLIFAAGIIASALRPEMPWNWCAYSLTLASFAALFPFISQLIKENAKLGALVNFYSPLAAELVCLALIIAASTFMTWPAAAGDRPVTGDHNLHYFRFWFFMTRLLPRFQLFGWNSLWFAGEPVGYVYPFAGPLWAAAVYVLTLGQLSLSQSYSLAIWLAYLTEGLCLYYCAKFIFNRGAGVLAALLFVTDIGDYINMGGWYMTVKTGVWPNTLSVGFSLLALRAFIKLLEEGRRQQIASVALWAGVSLFIHPIQIVNLPLTLGLLLLLYVLYGRFSLLRERFPKIAAAAILSLMIAAVWLLPFSFYAASRYVKESNKAWVSLSQMGDSIYYGTLFPGMWLFTAVLGPLGGVALLCSKKPRRLLVGLLFFIFMLIGSNEFAALLAQLFSKASAQKIEYLRFSTLLRPYWAMAAAWALVRIFSPKAVVSGLSLTKVITKEGETKELSQNSCSKPPIGRIFAQTFVCSFVALPLLIPFFHGWYLERHEMKMTTESRRDNNIRGGLVSWISQRAAETPDFFRVAVFDEMHMHSLFDLATQVSVPVYNLGFSPVSNFFYQLGEYDPRIMEALSVRYIIATESQQEKLWKLHQRSDALLKPVGRFDKLYISEFANWNPKRYQIVNGAGEVKLVSFEDEKIVLEASPGSTGELRLPVTYFERWEAARNGEPIEIKISEIGLQNRSAFMTVDLKPGRYEFSFKRHWQEKVGFLLSVIGLVMTAWILVGKKPFPGASFLH